MGRSRHVDIGHRGAGGAFAALICGGLRQGRSGRDCGDQAERDQKLKRGCDYLCLLFSYTGQVMSRYERPSHRVYMTFMLSHGSWFCQSLEADTKTPLPRKLNFADPEKIRELVRRGEAWGDLESKRALEHGIERGRGGVWLRLTPDQYARLRRS
jgi:hypothetical protein